MMQAGMAMLAGVLIGSFLNVLIHRLPRMASGDAPDGYTLAWPRSHCPACGHTLHARHLIPLLSWLALRGRCGFCRSAISPRYPLVELATALLFGFLAWRQAELGLLAGGLAFTACLIALTVIDLETGLLPDNLTLPLLWGGLLFNLHGQRVPLDEAVLGAVAGYGVLWGLYWLHRLASGREGLGYGDFKLLAAIGAWLGWRALPPLLLMSSLTGLCVAGILMLFGRMSRRDALPFGPFLALSGWVVWVWGSAF
ncbi:prepilin peptidase [Paludibacterium purpuratum]|uniref:Prepilin leader peptidase/N-methyltransferase n=1 Tax=Paludibacterium purpuratum TaxID=1144873 RepID=A0A4R7B1I1_9NEIS|nr:A24 family peptidase [Paludibacterium purpuratum]TDR76746.1 type 4 prepilin peptidase 1 [Paludibacterium purpuratum]